MTTGKINTVGAHPGIRRPQLAVTVGAFLGMWFPFGSLIGPLILWQVKRESDPFIDDQGKEALNFQITVAIASAICYVLMFVLIGFALLGLVLIGAVVLVGMYDANPAVMAAIGMFSGYCSGNSTE